MSIDLAAADALLSTTRAVRKRLDFTRPVPRQVIMDCIALSQQAPTASNGQTWRWVVVDDAATRMRVEEVSIGDYVLAGGEAAALVMIESVVRLLPNVMGNPLSHQDDSHSAENAGLLEGPSYTRPPNWRGLDVPDVLLSGDHAKIKAWRHEQALQRTRGRRPDLLGE